MSPDMLALGRRAVACPGWRWMPGMRVECPGALVAALEAELRERLTDPGVGR